MDLLIAPGLLVPKQDNGVAAIDRPVIGSRRQGRGGRGLRPAALRLVMPGIAQERVALVGRATGQNSVAGSCIIGQGVGHPARRPAGSGELAPGRGSQVEGPEV